MLDPEAEKDDAAGTDDHFHGCRTAGDRRLAFEPTAHQQIPAAPYRAITRTLASAAPTPPGTPS